MPITRHVETHFTATQTVRDIVIGMADGLTVPFALAAGLAGTVAVADVIVVAGLAEIAAGAIAMGLGGYLAARTDSEHYTAERARASCAIRRRCRSRSAPRWPSSSATTGSRRAADRVMGGGENP